MRSDDTVLAVSSTHPFKCVLGLSDGAVLVWQDLGMAGQVKRVGASQRSVAKNRESGAWQLILMCVGM